MAEENWVHEGVANPKPWRLYFSGERVYAPAANMTFNSCMDPGDEDRTVTPREAGAIIARRLRGP